LPYANYSCMTETKPVYQPKGSMCMACTKRNANCSHLKYSDMPVIQRTPNWVIVKCTDFNAASKC
jgi:hypothetical protein